MNFGAGQPCRREDLRLIAFQSFGRMVAARGRGLAFDAGRNQPRLKDGTIAWSDWRGSPSPSARSGRGDGQAIGRAKP